MWQKLANKWRRLNRPQRLILLEAGCALTAAQVAIHLLPFRWIAPRLGRLVKNPPARSSSPEHPPSNWSIRARRVGWAVQNLARFLPWDARCLAQAIAGKWMLQRRGLPSILYLGVDHGQEQWLEAHAWLRCGNEFVTGEPQHERFKVIAAFVEGPS